MHTDRPPLETLTPWIADPMILHGHSHVKSSLARASRRAVKQHERSSGTYGRRRRDWLRRAKGGTIRPTIGALGIRLEHVQGPAQVLAPVAQVLFLALVPVPQHIRSLWMRWILVKPVRQSAPVVANGGAQQLTPRHGRTPSRCARTCPARRSCPASVTSARLPSSDSNSATV
jgi:hypothetical protein